MSVDLRLRPARGGGIPEISDHEFALFQAFIKREAGIHLAPSKKPMLVCRLFRRLDALHLGSFAEYYRHVTHGHDDERTRMLDAICTNETWFFRNEKHFELLRDELAPRWIGEARASRRARELRVWSAGCSSGEEPFSLAMVLHDALPDWTVEVLATDLSHRALALAGKATWPLEKSERIPARYLKRYMLRGTGAQEGKMRASEQLRSLVRFLPLNLNENSWPVDAAPRFEILFCRNVLMYFSPSCRRRVLRRLLDCLVPGGFLFLGDAEALGEPEDRLLPVIPAVYRRRDEGQLERAGAGAGS
jgi:chemotaxis protein methyltransferase CheR